jgi:hypothetical protein
VIETVAELICGRIFSRLERVTHVWVFSIDFQDSSSFSQVLQVLLERIEWNEIQVQIYIFVEKRSTSPLS